MGLHPRLFQEVDDLTHAALRRVLEDEVARVVDEDVGTLWEAVDAENRCELRGLVGESLAVGHLTGPSQRDLRHPRTL